MELPKEYGWFWQRNYYVIICTIWPRNNQGFFIRGYGRTKEEAFKYASKMFVLFLQKEKEKK